MMTTIESFIVKIKMGKFSVDQIIYLKYYIFFQVQHLNLTFQKNIKQIKFLFLKLN